MAKKKTNNISSYDPMASAESLVREAFLRASRNTLENFGIETYSIEQVRGMVDLLEQVNLIKEEN